MLPPEELFSATLSAVISKNAPTIDETAQFPRENIQALGKAGLLGLTTRRELGGQGGGFVDAAHVVEKLAEECASTAMIVCMHYCANSVLEKFAPEEIRRLVARGDHLSTLAFSEQGSRSHFWAPLGTAQKQDKDVVLDATKSWVTAAGEADSYVWSSKPVTGSELSTLWFVPSKTAGLKIPAPFRGMGLRGNASSPINAEGAVIPETSMLGTDGAGFGIMMSDVLPMFTVLNASGSLGVMSSALRRSIDHVKATALQHLGQSLADLPTIRAYLAKAQIEVDAVRTLRDDTLQALAAGRADAMLRVLEVKAAAGEAALRVTDIAMRVCGGAAFRKEVGVERNFRDARAASVMGPTSDVLYDFIGKAICNQPLF